VYCPLLSLPAVMKTALETIPAAVAYLHADEAKRADWAARLAVETRRKIGLVWAGRPTHGNDRQRSVALSRLAPLWDIANVRWISLQQGEAGRQSADAPMEMADWSSEMRDFADTAAVIANLDLVITVDTAVAHLAGAMGRPVWVLLPFVPDWRWMLERRDSPWYPTMRLFRQARFGDWDGVIGQVKAALQNL
jgi:hypothetical protein